MSERIEDFVTTSTVRFFTILGIRYSWLEIEPVRFFTILGIRYSWLEIEIECVYEKIPVIIWRLKRLCPV